MAKTVAALNKLGAAGLPHLSVLTDPCYGGVTASYATVADVVMAEPGAMIGFAGPRVIEQTTKQKLPEGFQTAEFLLEHGMIDLIISRDQLRAMIGTLLSHYAPASADVGARPVTAGVSAESADVRDRDRDILVSLHSIEPDSAADAGSALDAGGVG